MTAEVKVYFEDYNTAKLGPLFAHQVGDELTTPDRHHPLLGHAIAGDVWVVQRIAIDGIAEAVRKSSLDVEVH